MKMIWILAMTVLAGVLSAGSAEHADPLETMRTLIAERRFDDAVRLGSDLLVQVEKEHGSDSLEAASFLDDFVRGLWDSGNANDPRARPMAERALAIKQARLEPGDTRIAHSVRNLGILLFRSQNPQGAREYLRQALVIYEQAGEPDEKEIRNTVRELANLLDIQGDHAKAKKLHERDLRLTERINGPDSTQMASALQNYGNSLFRLGDLLGAGSSYERGIQILEMRMGPEGQSLSGILTAYGFLMWQMGDLGKARSSLERAIAISEKKLGVDSVPVADALSNLGILLMETDLPAARIALDRSLAIREKMLGEQHPSLVISLNNLGVVAHKLGDYDAAADYYRRSLAIAEEKLGHDHPNVGRNINNLADLLTIAGKYDEARPLYRRALAIYETRLGEDHPDVAEALESLAGLELAAARPGESLDLARRAATMLDRHVGQIVSHLPERQALLLVSAQPHPEGILFAGLLSLHGEEQERWLEACWEWTLRRRGLVLEELARRNRLGVTGETQETRDAWSRVGRARQELGELWVSGLGELDPSEYREKLDAARDRKERAEADLARLSTRYLESGRNLEVDRRRIRSALPPGASLVEVVRVRVGLPTEREQPWRDIALVMNGGAERFVDLGPSVKLDEAVTAWRGILEDSAAETASGVIPAETLARIEKAGEEVRRRLWDPIEQASDATKTMYLVPDGAYHMVDLRTLPTAAGRFVVDTGPDIRLLNTARDLLNSSLVEMPSPGHGILVLGDPDFGSIAEAGAASRGARSECAAMADSNWAPLPVSRREARQVQRLLARNEDVLLLTGVDAREESLRREAVGKRVLHLATHGFFFQDECGASLGTAMTPGPGIENPLLLSGLALAGANLLGTMDGKDDGILTAEEVAALDLNGVELVVLSACDTGRGTISIGEGVFGLRLGFEMAGARNVIMNLWRVPDRQALGWMTHFYENLAAGSHPHEAAKRATVQALETLRQQERSPHPYLWGGFLVAGFPK